MKRIFTLIFILIFAGSGLYAQSSNDSNSNDQNTNCFLKWAQVFEKRGAYHVKDSTYTNVIISFRSKADADCYVGKAIVKKGLVVGIYIKAEDGSYQKLNKKLKYNSPVTIDNGMSSTLETTDGQLINVIFVGSIKPKPKKFVRAPDPTGY